MNCWELSDANHIPKAAPESTGSQWVWSVSKSLLVQCKPVGACVVDVLCVCVCVCVCVCGLGGLGLHDFFALTLAQSTAEQM